MSLAHARTNYSHVKRVTARSSGCAACIVAYGVNQENVVYLFETAEILVLSRRPGEGVSGRQWFPACDAGPDCTLSILCLRSQV